MTTPTQAAVARRQEQQPSLATVVQTMVPEIRRALPRHMDADRMARLALTVIRQTPALARCTPESFAGALLTASALGLEPGVNGEAYLVPHGRECTLIVGYQGYAKLFWQHPLAEHLDAQAVYEGDDFDYAYGLDPFLRHKPAAEKKGNPTHYYAVAKLSTGARAFVVLTADEVKALRQGKVGPSGSIVDPMRWMERKTAVRQLVKMLPKSPNLARALDVDEVGGHTLQRQQIAANTPAAIDAPPVEGDVLAEASTGNVAEPDWPEVTEPPR